MANHAENCKWNGFDFDLYHYDPDGPDIRISIDETKIFIDNCAHDPISNNIIKITFNFCPVCGCNLND
jgi:hypothetical protein